MNTPPQPRHVNIVFDEGGLGDSICRIVAVKALAKEAPGTYLHVWVSDYFEDLGRHLLQDFKGQVFVKPFKRMQTASWIDNIPGIHFQNSFHTTLRTHLVDHAFHILLDRMALPSERYYPSLRLDQIDVSSFKLPERYVVLTSDHTAPVREMPASTVDGVAKWLVSKGVTPVYIGKQYINDANHLAPIDASLGIDLRNKTTLLEAGKIMAGAVAVVGLDNGLIHLAACSDVPIVVAYTSLEPTQRLPYRDSESPIFNVEPNDCNRCQSTFRFGFGHDFRTCYLAKKCGDTLTADKFIKCLDSLT